MNLRSARRPRGDFDPLPPRPRELAPRAGFVLPRDYAGPDVLRVGQVVRLELAGGEVTPGLSAEMLKNAAMASAGTPSRSLFVYEGCHYGSPEDAWLALRVVRNPIPLVWIVGSIAATLGGAWAVREVVVDDVPAGQAQAPGALSGISLGVGVGGLPLLAGLALAWVVWKAA